jgi:hypothetical protein
MLLCHIILLIDIPLQSGKYIPLIHEVRPTMSLNVKQRVVRDPVLVRRSVPVFWGYREILEFFSEDDDRLLREQRVLGRRRAEFGGWRTV